MDTPDTTSKIDRGASPNTGAISKTKKSDMKWTFLEHKGPAFHPPYEPLPSNVKFYYDGSEMKLNNKSDNMSTEEVATLYARSSYSSYKTNMIFNRNFMDDWRSVMTEKEKNIIAPGITGLEKCKFTEITVFLEESKNPIAIEESNVEIKEKYGYCNIDGQKEKIEHYMVEPPGLFLGRGDHPSLGKLIRRKQPEDVTINCSCDSIIPEPPAGHQWQNILHDRTLMWLASWRDNATEITKYMQLSRSSNLTMNKDREKYENARLLATSIDKVRKAYREDWWNEKLATRQKAIVVYFLDKLGLREGSQKKKNSADTVGCSTLRREHIKLTEDNNQKYVTFNFRSKDAVVYHNEVPVEPRVYQLLETFIEGKADDGLVFDTIKPKHINKYLNEIKEGLTSKMFRTCNSSRLFEQKLNEFNIPNATMKEKIDHYEEAAKAAAKFCDHKRTKTKIHDKSMVNTKLGDENKSMEEKCKKIKDWKTPEEKDDLEKLNEQFNKMEINANDQEKNMETSERTTIRSYLDPRITVAWCLKHNIPIEKVFAHHIQDLFKWAIKEQKTSDFVF